jgi:hypothetical protein
VSTSTIISNLPRKPNFRSHVSPISRAKKKKNPGINPGQPARKGRKKKTTTLGSPPEKGGKGREKKNPGITPPLLHRALPSPTPQNVRHRRTDKTITILDRVIISWRILVSFRGFFEDYNFCMVKYLSFHNSSFKLCLKILYFYVNWPRSQCHTHPLFVCWSITFADNELLCI